MPALFSHRALWNAVLLTLVLHACDEIVSRHLWEHVVESFVSAVPLDWWREGGEDVVLTSRNSLSDRKFYLQEMPKSLLMNLALQILAFYKACWLERAFPTRPQPERSDTAQAGEVAKEIRGREEMEQEIMQKLIADGRVTPAGIQWRSVLFRWLVDDTLGTLLFGIVGHALYSATRLHPLQQIVQDYPQAVGAHFLSYWLSPNPVFSIIGHAYVPAIYRIQFWAAADLALNLSLSLLLRPIVPWFMRLEPVKNFFEEGAAQNRLNSWWAREMKRHDVERKKLDAEMQAMFDGWKTDADQVSKGDEL
ncbi:hypothetical protein LTR86_009291 [Recurvomyces mirabilis]|nr:hypothetical protein LTR86_009291 [Recurvomyces mirabilis]